MTDCLRFDNDLKAYADGELSWLRRRAVRRHLTHCASCQEEIAQMTQIAEDLRTTEDLRTAESSDLLSPGLREKILRVEPTQAQVPTLPIRSNAEGHKREGEEFQRAGASPAPTLRPPVSGGPLRSNLLRSKEVGSRKRPVIAWGLVGAVLAAWFIIVPIIARHSITAYQANRVVTAAPTAPLADKLMLPPAVRSLREVHALPPMAAEPAPPVAAISGNTATETYSVNGSGSVQTFDSLRQVHKEASIGVQVANPEATGDTINTMVTETGGYVASNNLSTDPDGLKSGELVVKVPVAQFETFLAHIAKLGSVQSKNISGEDITEQTSDAGQAESVLEDDVQQSEARLKSLGSKAKWHDEQATRDLRIQLAQAQARLVLLKRMAALGTITIDLSQTPKAAIAPPVTGGFLNTLKGTTHDALQSLVGSAGALLALVIWLLAYAPIWIPVLLIGRYALKEYRKREAAG